MEILYHFNQVFISSFQGVWFKFIEFLPNLIAAILVLIIGLFLADFLGRFVSKVLTRLYVDRVVEKTGLKKNLEKLGFKITISRALGLLVVWFLYAVVLIGTAEILQLNQISQFLQAVVLYIPNVIVAVVILVVGIVVSNFISIAVKEASFAVKEASLAAKLTAADLLSTLAKWAILVFSFMAALIQLKVAPELIQILFTGVVLMVALAGGIAFGLGGKDKAKELLDKLSQK